MDKRQEQQRLLLFISWMLLVASVSETKECRFFQEKRKQTRELLSKAYTRRTSNNAWLYFIELAVYRVRKRFASFFQQELNQTRELPSKVYTRRRNNNASLLVSSSLLVSFREWEKEGVWVLPGETKTNSLTVFKSVHKTKEQQRMILFEWVGLVVSESVRKRGRGMREGSHPQETGEQTNVIQHQKTIARGWRTRTPLPLLYS